VGKGREGREEEGGKGKGNKGKMQTNYVPKALWDHDDSFIRGVDR